MADALRVENLYTLAPSGAKESHWALEFNRTKFINRGGRRANGGSQ